MTTADFIAAAGVLLMLLLSIAAGLIAWGVTQGALKALTGRVDLLEAGVKDLGDLKVTVARIGERQDIWIEQLRDLNASIRWMREPAPAYEPRAQPGISRPRKETP